MFMDVVDLRTGAAIGVVDAAAGETVPIALTRDGRTVGSGSITVRIPDP